MKAIKELPHILAVFDNGGETYDRYTVIDSNGDMYGYSGGHDGVLGYDQFCGNISYLTPGQSLSFSIQEFEEDGNIGKRIRLLDLPIEVIRAYKRRVYGS